MDTINTSDIQGQDTAVIDEVQSTSVSEEELFEQVEHENVDFIAPKSMDDDIDEAMTLLQTLQAKANEIEDSDDTLRILQLAYSIYQWSQKSPDEFEGKCSEVNAKARSDAKAGVIIFNYLEKASRTQWAKQYKTRWAKTLRLAERQSKSVVEFADYLKSLGGWSAAAKFYDKLTSEDSKAERNQKKLENTDRIQKLEQDVKAIAQLPDNDGLPMCSGTAGLGLLVYREGVNGEDGILCRLNITADDVEKLIHKHRGSLSNGQVEDVIAVISTEGDANNV